MDGVGRSDGDMATVDDDGIGNRARKRDSLFLSARFKVGEEQTTTDVRVRNLSEGGLMAELDRAVAPGTAVTLELRGLGTITGAVAWCAHGRLGIALDHPIDPARARKPVGTGKATTESTGPSVVPAPRR